MLRRLLAVLGITAGTSLLIASCGGGSEADVERGATIYAQQCARCHGDEGQGNLGPSLVGIADLFQEASGQELFVSNGGAGMPRFADILSEDEIRDVVAYTRQTFR